MLQRKTIHGLSLASVLAILLPSTVLSEDTKGVHWPSFRGAHARGVAEKYSTPTRWSALTSENILWKTPIPGLGHSSPIVWGDRLFVTSAIRQGGDASLKVGLYGNIKPVDDDTSHEWRLYCIDKRTGKVLWQRTAQEGTPTIQRHPKSSHANSTPATDGEHVVAFYGSEGVFCYDVDGMLLWKKDLGLLDSGYYVVPAAQWGFGSSPVIYENRVIVQCDVQEGSFLAAFDIEDGKEIWRQERDEVPTWSTPTIHQGAGRTQIIVNGYRHIGGYDAATGEELWKLTGGGDIPVPTPIVGHGLIYITNAHGRSSPIYAIRTTACGDITLPKIELTGATSVKKQPGSANSANKLAASANSANRQFSSQHIVWGQERGGNYMQTPLLYGEWLYCCRDNGVLTCFEAKTGKMLYRQRLGRARSGFSASPVAADGKLYWSSEDGQIFVVQSGPKFELLAQNEMGETCMATPAISEGTLFFRTRRHLVAVAEEDAK